MSKEVKIVVASVVLCVLGCVVYDCGVHLTGGVMCYIGFMGMFIGPLLVNL